MARWLLCLAVLRGLGCVPAPIPEPSPVAGHSPGPDAPTLAPDSRLAGSIRAPARLIGNTGNTLIGNTGNTLIGNTGNTLAGRANASYRAESVEVVPVARALVYLMTADERFYLDEAGKAVLTTSDEAGRYELPAAAGKELIVSAALPGNRRLVGYTLIPSPGAASLDVSLASTYVAEFLRYHARRDSRSLSSYDPGKVSRITTMVGAAVEDGRLSATPDIGVSEIPGLVADYQVAVASGIRELSDAWTDMLGRRPLAVSEVPGAAAAGWAPRALLPLDGRLVLSEMGPAGARIREAGRLQPVLFRSAREGFWAIHALARDPAGMIDFAARTDRFAGGAVDREGPPSIRLFRLDEDLAGYSEVLLRVPEELAPYLADTTQRTQIEPADMAWHGSTLYVADSRTGLVYEYPATASVAWTGSVYAGLVRAGRPVRGFAAGARRQAQFEHVDHLAWHGEELYLADGGNGVIRKIARDGQVSVVAGIPGRQGFSGDGGPALECELFYPQGIAFDGAGRLYIADGDNRRVRVVENGRIRTAAGGGSESPGHGDPLGAGLGQLFDLAFDADGNLLFTDEGARTVRRLWLQYAP